MTHPGDARAATTLDAVPNGKALRFAPRRLQERPPTSKVTVVVVVLPEELPKERQLENITAEAPRVECTKDLSEVSDDRGGVECRSLLDPFAPPAM